MRTYEVGHRNVATETIEWVARIRAEKLQLAYHQARQQYPCNVPHYTLSLKEIPVFSALLEKWENTNVDIHDFQNGLVNAQAAILKTNREFAVVMLGLCDIAEENNILEELRKRTRKECSIYLPRENHQMGEPRLIVCFSCGKYYVFASLPTFVGGQPGYDVIPAEIHSNATQRWFADHPEYSFERFAETTRRLQDVINAQQDYLCMRNDHPVQASREL